MARKLTTAEMHKELAERGDVEALWQVLLKAEKGWADFDVEFGHLLRAMEVAGARDPARFAADLLARMLAFSGFLVLRVQLQAARLIAAHDRSPRLWMPGELPRQVTDLTLPGLLEMQGHVAELAAAQAAVARSWALTEGKEYENQVAAGALSSGQRTVRPAGQSEPPQGGPERGATTGAQARRGRGLAGGALGRRPGEDGAGVGGPRPPGGDRDQVGERAPGVGREVPRQ
jgi:hypothetical protein